MKIKNITITKYVCDHCGSEAMDKQLMEQHEVGCVQKRQVIEARKEKVLAECVEWVLNNRVVVTLLRDRSIECIDYAKRVVYSEMPTFMDAQLWQPADLVAMIVCRASNTIRNKNQSR